MNKKSIKILDIVVISLFSAILFIQEQILYFLPNIQLTFFLIVLYSKVLKWKKCIVIITIHVLLDNLVNGSLNIIYTPAMFVGYMFIPLLLSTLFKKVNDNIGLSILSIFFALIYSFCFAITSSIFTEVTLYAYLVADLLFVFVLAASSALSVLLLYNPCYSLLLKLLKGKEDEL